MRSVSRQLPPPPGPTLGLPEIIAGARTEAARLGELQKWKFAFRQAAPDPPLLVERLDLSGRFYSIVPFRIGSRLTGRIAMDAHTARYEVATGVVSEDTMLERYQNLDDVWKRLLLPPSPPRTRSRDGNAPPPLPPGQPVVEPILVWRPSLQSRSPFLPFHVVRFGRTLRYMRVDGREFDDLVLAAGT